MEHTHHDSGTSNFLSAILWITAGFFEIMQTITIESAYVWLFRLLSLISVILVIIINWPKAKAILRSNKKHPEKK